MQYTPEQRRLICGALKAAKPFLNSGRVTDAHKCRPICYALQDAMLQGKMSEKEAQLTEKMICRRLGNYVFLTDWLAANVPGFHGQRLTAPVLTRREVQKYRHRWVDSIIQEFSK